MERKFVLMRKEVIGVFFECCDREDPGGTLNVQPWLALSWASRWTSTGEGLICDSLIMTTSWLSQR